MKKTYHLNHIQDLAKVAQEIWLDFGSWNVFLLSGDLGAGKTTLIQAFGEILQVIDDVVSPTYTLINIYKTQDGKSVYHADLYRIESLEEAIQTGIEDYLYSNSPCFIEWPEIIEPILPSKFVKLEISINTSDTLEAKQEAANGRLITAELHA